MFAVIHLPNFALQALLRHEPSLASTPVALLREDSPKSPVWQVTPAAERFDVIPGLTSTQAKARCETIAFRVRSFPQEESAQEILLECAYGSAAYIESTAPGVCTLDLRGLPLLSATPLSQHLELWASQLRTRLVQFHLSAHIGIAATPALALQAAQSGQTFLLVTNPAEFWTTLPIESLDPAPELLDILRKWGIRTVGSFLGLGKSGVAERLGAEGGKLFEAARCNVPRPLRLTAPQQLYQEYFEFAQPVETLEPLLFMLRRFLDQLCARVEQSYLVVQELVLSLKLESGQSHERALKIPAPTREVEVLFRILHNYLEIVRTPSPVMAISLRALPCPAETQQFQLFETAVRDPNRFYETIGRLSALLGSERVGTPVIQESHRSDDWKMAPVSAPQSEPIPRKSGITIRIARGPLLRRFRPPQPASVQLSDGQPRAVRGAGLNAVIIQSRGPWRRSGHWWENPWSREEWDVQTDAGGLYRVFREGNNWFIEGAYD